MVSGSSIEWLEWLGVIILIPSREWKIKHCFKAVCRWKRPTNPFFFELWAQYGLIWPNILLQAHPSPSNPSSKRPDCQRSWPWRCVPPSPALPLPSSSSWCSGAAFHPAGGSSTARWGSGTSGKMPCRACQKQGETTVQLMDLYLDMIRSYQILCKLSYGTWRAQISDELDGTSPNLALDACAWATPRGKNSIQPSKWLK